jgi:single-strand DNA-binding protein
LGRLTAEPEYRTTPNGIAVTTFSLAVDRKRTKDKAVTDFFTIVAWRTLAEFAAKYLHKGQRVLVTGELQTRNYTDKQGVKRYVTEVSVDSIYFADRKQDAPTALTESERSKNNEYGHNRSTEQVPPG